MRILPIIILVFITGCISSSPEQSSTTIQMQKVDDEISISSNTLDCHRIAERNKMDFCYNQYADENNDLSTCNKISNTYWMQDCYRTLSMRLDDKTGCEKINSSKWNKWCIKYHESKPDTNSKTTEISLKEKPGGIVDCNKKTSFDDLNLCLARKHMDHTYCLKINQSLAKDVCISMVAKKTKDRSLCELIKVTGSRINPTSQRDLCYLDVATIIKDQTICELITVPSYKQRCIGELSKGIDHCEEHADPGQKDVCYLLLGQKNLDINACIRINHIQNRYSCISFVASGKKDTNLCNKIEDHREKEACIGFVEYAIKNIPP